MFKNKQKRLVTIMMLIISMAMVINGCSPKAPSGGEAAEGNENAVSIDYPKSTITMIVPTSAGGGYDLGVRNIARFLPKHLPNNVNVIVENVPGAGQMIGVHSLFAAKPDGYTIGGFDGSGALISQFARPDATKYDVEKFEYLGVWQVDARMIGVSNAIEATTWDEFVEFSKKSPIKVGTGGVGTGQHTDALMVEEFTDVDFKYVHYDGSANIEPGIARKEVDMEIAQYSTLKKLQDQDIGRPFCVLSDERSESAPDVPTALEIGMPKEQYEKLMSSPFYGTYRVVAAPPGTDPQILEILRKAVWDTFQDPEYIEEVKKMKAEYNPIMGEEYAASLGEKVEIGNSEESKEVVKLLQTMTDN